MEPAFTVSILIEGALAGIVALVVAAAMVWFFHWRRPGRENATNTSSTGFLFVLLLFAVWVGGVWLQPIGPTLLGVAWAPFALVGLFVGLLLLAVAAPRGGAADREGVAASESSPAAVGAFFWILVVGLGIVLLLVYSI